MFTDFETFFKDYRIKNNAAPNETVLNVGLLRLKREIRELESLYKIICQQDIEEWNPEKAYERDEYIQYGKIYYKSLVDNNVGNDPHYAENYWELVDLYKKGDNNTTVDHFHYISYIAEQGQTTFVVEDKALEGVPCVFVDGILIERTEFTYESWTLTFPIGLQSNQVVVLIFGIAYDMGIISPASEQYALKDQTRFTTTFDLTSPHVHVNGVLLSRRDFKYGRNWVDLLNPCDAGDVIMITNGSTVGLEDYYTKSEINGFIENVWTKDESYSKEQTDAEIDKLEEQIYTDDNIAKTTNVYTKNEIDNFLVNKVSTDAFEELRSNKADKSDTLAGYGITNAYVKHEVDALLLDKVSKNEFTAETIFNILGDDNVTALKLNASSLGGIPADRYYVMDQFQTINDGFYCLPSNSTNVHSITMKFNESTDLPDLRVASRENTYAEVKGRIFNSFNSKDLIVNIQGGFKGTFAVDIKSMGIVNPQDYNWTVHVEPIIIPRQLKFDFMPKDYGFGYKYNGFYETTEVQCSCFMGTVVDNIMKCWAYAEISANVLREWQAAYHLQGIHKSISTNLYYNQGQGNLDYFMPVHADKDEFDNAVAEAGEPQVPPVIRPSEDNGMDWLNTIVLESLSNHYYQHSMPSVYQPIIMVEDTVVTDLDPVEITIIGGIPNGTFDYELTGLATLVTSTHNFNRRGEAILAIQANETTTGTATLTIKGDNIKESSVTFELKKVLH